MTSRGLPAPRRRGAGTVTSPEGGAGARALVLGPGMIEGELFLTFYYQICVLMDMTTAAATMLRQTQETISTSPVWA